jgi:hypothetical protein
MHTTLDTIREHRDAEALVERYWRQLAQLDATQDTRPDLVRRYRRALLRADTAARALRQVLEASA